MFHVLSAWPGRSFLCSQPATGRGIAALALAGFVGLTAGAAILWNPTAEPEHVASLGGPVATLVSDQPAALADTAEAARARLLALPGVGAVTLNGLQVAGLELDYSPARLLRLGVREADLRAAVPVQDGPARPGRLPLRLDASQGGPESVVNLPVQAGSRVFRLGDLVSVARVPLREPLPILRHDGHPAVEISVVPAIGAAGPTLDRRVADSLATMKLPDRLALR